MTDDPAISPESSSFAKPRPQGDAAPGEAATLPAIDVEVFCPTCGYNLRGLTGNRCPECGSDIEAYRQRGSLLPWVYRDRIGRPRAFWKTVWLVTFNNRRFGMEMGRPVDEQHARQFRWALIAHAYLAVLATTLLAFVGGALPHDAEAILFAGVMLILVFAGLTVVTILPYWGFRHRSLSLETQRRAAVMMLYSSAPLAWLPVPGLMVVLGGLCTVFRLGDADLIVYCGVVALVVLIGAMMSSVIERVSRHALGATRAARRVGGKLICACVIAVLFFLLIVPASAMFLGVVYYSLH